METSQTSESGVPSPLLGGTMQQHHQLALGLPQQIETDIHGNPIDVDLSDSDSDADENAAAADGTRARNLTLWDAAEWQSKVFAIFEPGSFPSDIPASADAIAMAWAVFAMLTIVVSCASVLFESYPQYYDQSVPLLIGVVEVLSVVIFTFDLGVRFITCPSRLHYLIDPFNWIDLVAIMPFYFEELLGVSGIPSELRIVRVLRLVRILRVLRSRSVPGMYAVVQALFTSFEGLSLFLAMAAIALLISATAAYYAERGTRDAVSGKWYRPCDSTQRGCPVNGTEITPFQSIPDCFWWATAALSTVGYGDVVVRSYWGQFIAAATMLCGIFLMAFPTMILSGNYDAARRFGRLTNHGWETLVKKREGKVDTPRTRIRKQLGWLDDDEERRRAYERRKAEQQIRKDKRRKKSGAASPNFNTTFGGTGGLLGATMGGTVGGNSTLSGTGTLGGSGSEHSPDGSSFGNDGGLAAALGNGGVAGAGGRKSLFAATMTSNIPVSDVPEIVGHFTFAEHPYEVKRDANSLHTYFYEPLFSLATCADGGPAVRVVWGRCGQPTLVQFTLVLDHDDARDAATEVVNRLDPGASVRCDLGSGFHIRHYYPPITRRHREAGAAGLLGAAEEDSHAFLMLDASAAPAYRNSDFPIYFQWTKDDTELGRLTEDEVAEMAITHLMGTTLLLHYILPEPPVMKRVPIVQQVIHHTRLHRELALLAAPAEHNGDSMAYIARSDVDMLLEGVGGKLVVDSALCFEDIPKLDAQIIDAVLARMRSVRSSAVPLPCKGSVYSAAMLPSDAVLYEFPMGFFEADELDEVEEDALGYVEVKMRPFLSRTLRIDIRMETTVPDLDLEDE